MIIQMKAIEQYFHAGGTVYYAVQAGSYFYVCELNPSVWCIQMNSNVYYAVQGGQF